MNEPGCAKVAITWIVFIAVVITGTIIWELIPSDVQMIIMFIAIPLCLGLTIFMIIPSLYKPYIKKRVGTISTKAKLKKLRKTNPYYNAAIIELNKYKNEKENTSAILQIEEKILKMIEVKGEELFNEDSMKQFNNRPNEWLYKCITLISRNLLKSGQMHAYRGVLDTNGMEVLKIYDEAIDKLVEIDSDKYQKNDSELHKKNIRNEINAIG